MDAKGSGDRTRSTPHLAHASPFRPDPNDISADAEAPGTPVHMTLDSDETKYTDSSHWMSILDSIAELKGELDQITLDPPSVDSPEDHPGPELLFGTQRHATRQDIIAGLPPKSEADLLLDRYWRFVDVAPTIMHRPKFQKEYDEFWQNPTETPTMWIGILYGLFAIATRIQSLIEEHDGGIVDPSHRTFSEARQDFYRQKVAQCLILANYLKCPPFTMETFLGYFVIEYLRSQDTQHGIWLLVGMLVRTAFRMGLHREPSKLSDNKLTPFECEMRRRMWSMVVRLDLMSSGQVGLPRMIHSAMADTLEPSNLNDDDIHEDMTELPPSRSDTEYTPMLYTIIRNRVLTVFARVTDLVSSSDQPTYREILELDEELRTMFENIPESLKCKGAKEFDMSLPSSMPVLLLNLTYLKGLEMLHRPFLFMARTDSRYEYSRAACVDAALEILDFQNTLECQSKVHKNLWAERPLWWTSSWRLSSMMNHDFFLATTVLALDLDRDLVDPVPSSDVERVRFKSGQPTRAEIIEALVRVNNQIWARASHTSREARRVFSAVRYVLGKAGVGATVPEGMFQFQHSRTHLCLSRKWYVDMLTFL